ncbi:TauD/TfdA family dioxygenase [Roseovarius salinarum]|uniref:TauD/TfdA family dioxygenase n=1 Tax=Roseovarius salinarum TaxID=1981892 RepID=UPI000C3239DB|nr:TauD/TfdA family dioxygenase [Roseovarius salinarum]
MELTDRAEARMISLCWPDGTRGDFPYIWLRDNCPGGFHPDTRERTFDLMSVPLDVVPETSRIEADALIVEWQDGHASRFETDWLRAHRPGAAADDPAQVPPEVWRADVGAAAIPRVSADAVMDDDAVLADWLRAARAWGVSIVERLADSPEAGMDVARRVGFLRETNFGKTFEVRSKPNPNNLAYTADALPLHTDLANQEMPPGWQFLHCLVNEAEGGGSVFADGLAMAEDLRAEDPDAFTLLSTVSIPFRFHDEGCDIRRRQYVITLDGDGAVNEICYNAHLAGVFDMGADVLDAYYRAYRAFMAKTRDPAYQLTLKLEAGEMAVFDNRRVLHGRDVFDPSTGARYLHGCYVDRGEFDSRLRTLVRAA